jgi:hypothetical protein
MFDTEIARRRCSLSASSHTLALLASLTHLRMDSLRGFITKGGAEGHWKHDPGGGTHSAVFPLST